MKSFFETPLLQRIKEFGGFHTTKFDRKRRYVRPAKSGANCQIVKLSDHALRACFNS